MSKRIAGNRSGSAATNKRPSVRHYLEYIAFRTALGLARLIPFRPCTFLFAKVTAHYSIRTRRHRRALANLEAAFPDSSPADRERIAWAMWENVGRVMAEAIHVDRFLAEPQRLDLLTMRPLDEYEESKGLYIIVAMHSGNWEIGLLLSTLRGFRPKALYRTVANPLVDDYVRKSRLKTVSGGLFAVRSNGGDLSSTQHASREIVQSLRQGGPLGILADHHDYDGIEVPFFGRTVFASRVPATLAYQFDARVCVAHAVRVGQQSRFVGETAVLELPRTGNRQEDIAEATKLIFRQFEIWIRQHPEHWLWSQAPFVSSGQV